MVVQDEINIPDSSINQKSNNTRLYFVWELILYKKFLSSC